MVLEIFQLRGRSDSIGEDTFLEELRYLPRSRMEFSHVKEASVQQVDVEFYF
jgi:hypothetical protein